MNGTRDTACFHCGEPLLGSKLLARVNGRDEPVCCQGCLAVAELISGAGLADYYKFREQAPARPDTRSDVDAWAAYDQPEIAAEFVTTSGETQSVTLGVDGLRCSACSWLVDHVLQGVSGVLEASTNASTGRAYVSWERSKLTLGDVMRTIARLGYQPQPLHDPRVVELQQRERRGALKRLAVAALGMMQVMMFAVAVYSAELSGEVISAPLLEYFRIVSLLVATPVMFYAGAPIFAGALNSLRIRTIGMDVPVAAALVLAYSASVWNTFAARGEVYFDSVTMFIFFVTLARFIQMSVRYRTTELSDALARQVPRYAHRCEGDSVTDVPASALRVGDVLLVRPGEIAPADGVIVTGDSSFNEAMLTGESLPQRRTVGDSIRAGTQNCEHPVHVRVSAVAGGTVLSHIVALLQRAQAQKPTLSKAADAAAAKFLRYVLIGAGATCVAWLVIDPSRAFEATLAVLVVACPCAFAIATPAALSAATANLARLGVLITKPDALETLAHVDRMVFDKTGTLSHGQIAVSRCEPLGSLSREECLQIASAIELSSQHPLARAFASYKSNLEATDVRSFTGRGLQATVNGRTYRIGTPEFVAELRGATNANRTESATGGSIVVLGDAERELALFELVDHVRPNAPAAIEALSKLGVTAQLLSGDGPAAVSSSAQLCGIPEYSARQSPEDKLARVQSLQAQGHRVAMVGDGVNDAPVLAAADVSIAMGKGAALAHASAHMVLVNEALERLPDAVAIARRTLRIARQNMIWSATYNFGSLPLAALGLIPPWLAALGMSVSSIAVVMNAMRLLPRRTPSKAAANAAFPQLPDIARAPA